MNTEKTLPLSDDKDSRKRQLRRELVLLNYHITDGPKWVDVEAIEKIVDYIEDGTIFPLPERN
jgi:hypothetical protein